MLTRPALPPLDADDDELYSEFGASPLGKSVRPAEEQVRCSVAGGRGGHSAGRSLARHHRFWNEFSIADARYVDLNSFASSAGCVCACRACQRPRFAICRPRRRRRWWRWRGGARPVLGPLRQRGRRQHGDANSADPGKRNAELLHFLSELNSSIRHQPKPLSSVLLFHAAPRPNHQTSCAHRRAADESGHPNSSGVC